MGRFKFLSDILNKEEIAELTKDIPKKKRGEFADYLRVAYEDAKKEVPKIAIIGQTGVGKSSTLNALFGTHLDVHDVRPSTKVPVELQFRYESTQGTKGELSFFDMPGVGESIRKDKEHVKTYQKILRQCDLAIWVITAESRSMAFDERFIKDFIDNEHTQLASRLVIAINKVDIIAPTDWNNRLNIPSTAQERNIQDRILYVQETLGHVCPGLNKDRIVAYSAKHNYRLIELFDAMVRAISIDRAWVLNEIKDIASYLDHVDESVRRDPRLRKYLDRLVEGSV